MFTHNTKRFPTDEYGVSHNYDKSCVLLQVGNERDQIRITLTEEEAVHLIQLLEKHLAIVVTERDSKEA